MVMKRARHQRCSAIAVLQGEAWQSEARSFFVASRGG
jgi:hypothetical protein